MDTKQLITGSPKEGFYPIVQDTVTVIELNEAVIHLTNESSSEDIIAAFDSVEDFTTLLQNIRNTENIVNGVLVNNSTLVGKFSCNIFAHSTKEVLYIDGVFSEQYFNITITNTDGTFSCVKNAVFINKFVTDGDGSKFLSDDGTYKPIEAGDKTNVLILSLENDLANGQKDSPVEAEVSTALKDAISTGKACVIKSANSDILANLQQISDNVTIVMEQISRVGQTFVAVNTTITVNTATNVISDYQTGAFVLETEGDGNKFLSNNGKYKEIPQPDLSNYLAKNNTTEFTPTQNYEPATKKYVDDSTVYKYEYKQFSYQYEIGNNSISNSFQYEASVNISKKSYIARVNFKSSNGFIYSLVLPDSIIEYQAESNITCNADFRFNEINSLGYKVSLHIIVEGDLKINFNNKTINYNITNVNAICEQCILIESQYASLGEAVNTDGILYFVTPDA